MTMEIKAEAEKTRRHNACVFIKAKKVKLFVNENGGFRVKPEFLKRLDDEVKRILSRGIELTRPKKTLKSEVIFREKKI